MIGAGAHRLGFCQRFAGIGDDTAHAHEGVEGVVGQDVDALYFDRELC